MTETVCRKFYAKVETTTTSYSPPLMSRDECEWWATHDFTTKNTSSANKARPLLAKEQVGDARNLKVRSAPFADKSIRELKIQDHGSTTSDATFNIIIDNDHQPSGKEEELADGIHHCYDYHFSRVSTKLGISQYIWHRFSGGVRSMGPNQLIVGLFAYNSERVTKGVRSHGARNNHGPNLQRIHWLPSR